MPAHRHRKSAYAGICSAGIVLFFFKVHQIAAFIGAIKYAGFENLCFRTRLSDEKPATETVLSASLFYEKLRAVVYPRRFHFSAHGSVSKVVAPGGLQLVEK